MHILSLLHPKPEYIFRPSQIVRRLIREYIPSSNEYEQVMLPWGLPLRIRPRESIGLCIWRLGMFELPVSEPIYRLVDPGDYAIDVGANIGHMTSIMAVRAGATGRVLSFEPHPLTFDELNANVQRWAEMSGIGDIRAHRIALSDTVGEGVLQVPGEDSVYRGLASVAQNSQALGSRYPIQLRRLDEFIVDEERIGVMKIDVEGHEHRVLKGAERVLLRQGIRDIIFEDKRPYPSETTAFLLEAGYAVFAVGMSLWGLAVSPGSAPPETGSGYWPTYLATSDPERALGRLKKRGWAALNSFSRQRRP